MWSFTRKSIAKIHAWERPYDPLSSRINKGEFSEAKGGENKKRRKEEIFF